MKMHEDYADSVSKECSNRNMSDVNLRESCRVKINLKKFSGYTSTIDIYTFQTEFEKLYTKRITAALLPEYLKHNYLEGTALSSVNSMTNIDSIWARLKEAYGNTKVFLYNKLKEVNNFGEIWRIRDKEELVLIDISSHITKDREKDGDKDKKEKNTSFHVEKLVIMQPKTIEAKVLSSILAVECLLT